MDIFSLNSLSKYNLETSFTDFKIKSTTSTGVKAITNTIFIVRVGVSQLAFCPNKIENVYRIDWESLA